MAAQGSIQVGLNIDTTENGTDSGDIRFLAGDIDIVGDLTTSSTSAAAVEGGGLKAESDSLLSIIDSNFVGNVATYGGGMYNYSSSPTLTNCILWGNGQELYGSAEVTYCNVQGGYSGAGTARVLHGSDLRRYRALTVLDR